MIIKIFLLWRLGLLFLGAWGLSAFHGTNLTNLTNTGFLLADETSYIKALLQWDGGHYFTIAKFGYLNASDFAFFPLYPFFIKILSRIGGSEIAWGLIISNVSFLAFLIILKKTLTKKYSSKIAFNVFITYLFFPTAFFTTAYYSESLFLLLTTSSLSAIENKKYFLSVILVSLASLTRLAGSILIISYFYKYFVSIPKNNLISRKVISPILSALGICFYSAYLFILEGNPLQFNNVQALWGREVVDPLTTILSYFWGFFFEIKNPIDYLDFLITIFFLVILSLGIKKIPAYIWIFSMLSILIPASSGTLTSMPRYALSSIGAFIILGIYLEEKPHLKIPFWTISLLLQVILYVRFLNGFWVA